jgi:hypothetical protein
MNDTLSVFVDGVGGEMVDFKEMMISIMFGPEIDKRQKLS